MSNDDNTARGYRFAADILRAHAGGDPRALPEALRPLVIEDEALAGAVTSLALASVVERLARQLDVPLDPLIAWCDAQALAAEHPESAVERGLEALRRDGSL